MSKWFMTNLQKHVNGKRILLSKSGVGKLVSRCKTLNSDLNLIPFKS